MVPVLISGFGRSGTTAFMGLLGTDVRVAFDRVYPYETRYLTFLAKQAILAARRLPGDVHDAFRMCEANDSSGSAPPWWPIVGSLISLPKIVNLHDMWHRFAEQLNEASPHCSHYAEKAPYWLADLLRPTTGVKVLHLARDPRDVYLSVRSFAQSTGYVDARQSERDFDANQARDMAYQLVCFAEAERADRKDKDAIQIRYEDWVTDPKGVAFRLGAWLGLEFNAESSELSRHHDRHRTTKDVSSSVGRWEREPLPLVANEYLLPSLGSYGPDYGYDLPRPGADIFPDPRRPHSDDGEWERVCTGMRLTMRGSDAWIELLDSPIDATGFAEVWLCLRGNCGEVSSLYWCRQNEQYDEARVVHVPFHPGPQMQIIRFSVGKHDQWSGQIHQLRVDICNGPLTGDEIAEVYWVRLVH